MTDLISQLADAIVSLNNASPRLPTKAEIEEVINTTFVKPAIRMSIDAALLASYPSFLVQNKRRQLAADAEAAPAIFDQAKVGAYLANGPCPGSTDGSHAYKEVGTADSDVNVLHHSYRPTMRCPCGAIKR